MTEAELDKIADAFTQELGYGVGRLGVRAAINALNAAGFAVTPAEPSEALLASMAMRLNHGFGLDSEASRRSQLDDMRKAYEEVSGAGFFKRERAEFYRSMLPPPHPRSLPDDTKR